MYNINSLFIARQSRSQYQIERSLRFNSADSAYLSRTPASAGNRKTMTFSFWVKRSLISSTQQSIFSAGTSSDNYIAWDSTNDYIQINLRNGGSASNVFLITTPVFRDVSAWYHIVLAIDTTQATAADRVKLYVNGVQITAFGTTNYPTQNNDLNSFGNNVIQYIGQTGVGGFNYYLNGYLTEFHHIDGQALTPSSFGETDTITGVWKPKRYAGTYGTNGFFLKFADNSGTTAATLGKDSSGNGNNWTPNNFSVTAGAGNDSMIDSCTSYADGGNGRGNYCTLNPLDIGTTNMSLSNGNLDFTKSGVNFGPSRGTLGVTTGKWYFEMTANNTPIKQVGVSNDFNIRASSGDVSVSSTGGIGAAWDSRGFLYQTGTSPAYAYTFTTNDVVMVAFNAASGAIWFGKNGTWNTGDPAAGTSPAFTASSYSVLFPFVNGEGGGSGTCNFGQRAFAYTPPSGFLALNTQNLPEPTIKKGSSYMDTLLFTGDGASSRSISGLNFSPDFVWLKRRNQANDHSQYDIVRGATKLLQSSQTGAEQTLSNGLTAFNSNGFDVGTYENTSAVTYVAWCWDESATPGFDIVTYTGNGTNRTIAHSLGVAPSMIIFKNRNVGTTDWAVYFKSLVESNSAYYVALNTINAVQTVPSPWNGTLATSSVFSVGTWDSVNGNGNGMVAYLWSEVAGFSKFGSYTGNGSSDGPFVFCGFRPRWLMIKVTSIGGNSWVMLDSAREPTNDDSQLYLTANTNDAEYDSPAVNGYPHFFSNGFKLRGTSNGVNGSGYTYIFAAYAESPFKYALAR